jgi:hypothetical protein
MFDYPSVTAIAGYLAQHIAGAAPGTLSNGSLPGNSNSNSMSWQISNQRHAEGAVTVATELVSISSRYPAADSSIAKGRDAFWGNASAAADLQRVVPLSRWDMERVYTPQVSPDSLGIYARFAAVCSGVDLFDAAMFRLSANEALAIDPQVR